MPIDTENVYRDTDHRYLHDPDFRAAVKMLEAAAERHGFTPGELRQIAFKAALNIEERRALAPFVAVKNRIDRRIQAGMDRIMEEAETAAAQIGIVGVTNPPEPPVAWREPLLAHGHDGESKPCSRPDCEAGPGLAGRLKDGTPVFFGRTP